MSCLMFQNQIPLLYNYIKLNKLETPNGKKQNSKNINCAITAVMLQKEFGFLLHIT